MAGEFADLDDFAPKAAKANGAAGTPSSGGEFGALDDFPETKTTSGLGAFVRGAVGGAAPAAGALRGGFYGAEIGAATPVPGGALIGAVAGGLAGSFLTDEAQSWLLDKVPRFRDLLGQSEEQKAQDQKEHQALSFMGGLFPYAITMSPMAALEKDLPENATNFRKLLNNQYTARLMSAGIVGGMQLGQEAVEQEHVDWSHVAIATGFGLIFNKPNRLGEKISGIPARPPTTPPPPPPTGATEAELTAHYAGLAGHDFEIPTVAQIGDSIAGAGYTEDVFMGSESRNPAAENAAITAAATERKTIGPEERPDTENLARKTEPELFERYDAAQNRLAAARQWIREFNEPSMEQITALQAERDRLEAAEQAEIDKHNGWRGSPTRRRLGAQVREVQGQIDILGERAKAFREGRAVETADTAAARKEIMDANAELFELQPQIRAAYRAAADYSGAPIVVPPTTPPPVAEPLAAAPQPATQAGIPAPAVTTPAEPAAAAAPPITPAAPAPAPAPRPNEQQTAIAKVAYDRMVKAGEPPERADWLSRLTALATSVRAARFGGALGDAAGLYAREGEKYGVYTEKGRAFEVTPPPAQPDAPVPTNRQELAAFLAAGGKVAPESRVPGARPALVVPPPEAPRPFGTTLFEEPKIEQLVSEADKSKTPEELKAETLKLADEAESYGKAGEGFAAGMRSAANGGMVRPESMEFYRTRVAEVKAQAGKANEPVKETYGLADLIRGDRQAADDYRKILETKQPPSVASTLKYAAQRFQNLVEEINAAGFKFLDINSFNAPQDVQAAKNRASSIAGASVRLLKGLRGEKGDVSTGRVGTDLHHLDATVDASEEALAALQRAREPKEEEPLPVVEVKKAKPRGRRAVNPEHWDVLEFLASKGGLKPEPDTLALIGGKKNYLVPGFGNLIRKDGMSMDRALEAAIGDKFLIDRGEVTGGEVTLRPQDLRDLIDRQINGKEKQYRVGREEAVGPARQVDKEELRHQVESAFDYAVEQSGVDPKAVDAEIRTVALELMEHGTTDPLEAWKHAEIEVTRRAYEDEQIKSELRGVPGYDTEVGAEPEEAAGSRAGTEARPEEPGGAPPGGPARPTGEGAGQPLAEQDVDDYFQAAKSGKKLGAIRLEANGLATILRDMGSADASTIIHELGHHWLSTLIRDAAHPLAPQQLRDDAASALRYLGLKSADELNARTKKATKAQERWATGVEQYFYEGRAPAPELVPLFDRFKNWLRDVYKTIKDIVTAGGEHYPINDEFRGIMDRMLTMPDGETVIMPDTPRGGPTLPDIHAAEAEYTEPQEGEQVAERVIRERDQYAEELPPQVKTGLEAAAIERARQVLEAGGTKPAGEGEPVAGRGGEVVGRGGAAEPPAGSGGGGEELGKIVEGGAPARPESPTISTVGEGGRAEREHPLATGPTDNAIPTGDTKLVDKAGNVRMENVTNAEQARQAMRDSYERIGDEPRGDAATDGQLWELSTELGQDPNVLSYDQLRKHLEFLLGGTRDMAKKVLAARRMLKQSATDVGALAKRVRESWSDDDATDFAIAVTKHDMIQSEISGATASWGRTGRAFRDITEGWDVKAANKNAQMMAQTGKTLFQIKQMASLMAEYDSVNQVSQFIRDRGRPRAGRMVVEYWINGLISGVQTHMTYAVGNTILALEKIGPETATAAAIGAVRKSMGREGETVRIGEVAAGFRGLARGFVPALHSAAEAMRTGTTTLLTGEAPSATLRFQAPLSQLASQAVLDESAKFSDVMQSVYGIVSGIRDAVKAGAALQRAGGRPDAPIFGWEFSPRGAIPNFQYRGGTVLPIGDIARLPSRMVSAIHSFFRPLNYSIEIHQRAYREAANQNLQGAHFDSSVASNISKPPVEWMEAAHNMSNDLTLMGQGAEWTRKLSGLINHEFLGEKDPISGNRIPGTGWPFLKFIDPFVHISSNIINEALVKRTPIGLAPALFGKETPLIADLKGRNGNVRADMAAARMLTGTAMTILFGSLAAEGYVTGSEPSNPQDAALWRQVYQAHSVKIGDTWYAMNRLGPMGMLLSTAADLYNVAHNAEEGEYAEAAAALHHAVSQNILDESFMRGPSDLIKAIEEPGRYGASYVRNFVSSFVPFSVAMSQMARDLDPYTRQARTLTDAIVAKTPLLSQELLPRRDIWGEPLPSRYGLGADATAIWEKQVNADPVNRVLLDRAIKVAMVERKIRNVQLTPEQYDDYARISGRLTKLNLDRLILSPSFNQMPRGTQHDIILENMRQSRETAKNMMFMKYQSLLVDAHDAKMRRREGPQ